MGGFFGATLRRDCVLDVFFGVDYHSHLGTRRAGMASLDDEKGFQREIHNIENAPFRTKFSGITTEMHGRSCIGCISDMDPQPMLVRSKLGTYAISTIGIINNADTLVNQYLSFSGGHFDAMSGGRINATELVSSMIDQKSNFVEGIHFAQSVIQGTASILILREDGSIIAARDRMGRLPIIIGRGADGYCVSFESFAFLKLGYETVRELGPGEIVSITPDGITVLSPARPEKRICAFLWTYYGYPTSHYEGINVEAMRYRNGELLAEQEIEAGTLPDVDYVCGVPDSGTPHAIGFANRSKIPFARPFIKYTPTWPRSFMPPTQDERDRVAKMKLIPVHELIDGKKLLFVDDSIVRGTQLRETVEFLYENGAKEVHMRSACPPIAYSCKFLNFSRATSDRELIVRRTVADMAPDGIRRLETYLDGDTDCGRCLRRKIADQFSFTSLEFQSLPRLIRAIGMDPEDVCTYCWNGRE